MRVDDKGIVYGETIHSEIIEAETAKQAAYNAFRNILLSYEKELSDKYYTDVTEDMYGTLRDALTDHNIYVLLFTENGWWLEEYSAHGFWTGG